MTSVARDKSFSVVVNPPLIRLDEDVRFRTQAGSGVEKVVLESNLSAVRGAPHQNPVLVEKTLDAGKERVN